MKNFQKLTKQTFTTFAYFVNVMFMDNFLADLLICFQTAEREKYYFSILLILDCGISKTRKIT